MALRRGGTQKRWHTEEVARRRGRHRRTQKRKAQRHAEEVALRRGGTQKRKAQRHTEEEGTEAHRRGVTRKRKAQTHTEEEGTEAHRRGRHRGTQKRWTKTIRDCSNQEMPALLQKVQATPRWRNSLTASSLIPPPSPSSPSAVTTVYRTAGGRTSFSPRVFPLQPGSASRGSDRLSKRPH